ncbi:hypothetical protein [Desulforhopalus singaporensis]|nr:hypothetical protein [Desulforhopalus singaporensis]
MVNMISKLFQNWEVKKSIISPIVANLFTALLLFLSVMLFKEPIYRSLGLSAVEFPLYCLSEPYNESGNIVYADLFIINLESYEITENKIRSALKNAGSEQIKPYIRIVWDHSIGNILDIEEDVAFNKQKGKVILEHKKDDGEWIIKVKEIKAKAIMRFTIKTNYNRPITRIALATRPFKIVYPGK